MPTTWTRAEHRAWAPPDELTPSQWAERYRYLGPGQSRWPGPWRNDNAPYLSIIMDLCTRPGVAELNIVKGAQGGVSEAMRNVIGYLAHMDPEPCGIALPSRDKGRKIMVNRLLPMIDACPPLAALRTEKSADLQAEQIRLRNGFILHLMWSGSATAMASDPMRLAICDEVDKFEAWVGKEADPVSLVRKRLRTYGERAVLVNVSTPTTRFGKIWELVEASDIQAWFHVPCPHCGAFQPLHFPNLHYDRVESLSKQEQAARLIQKQAVWYECQHCHARIVESDRRAMTNRGEWRQAQGAPILDAYGAAHQSLDAVQVFPLGTRIGLHLSALPYLWESWSGIMAEFIRAEGSLSRLYDFRTETLGEPFEQLIVKTSAGVYASKSAKATRDEGIVPAWAVRVLATVDVQHDHFWVVLRAWGPDLHSARVWHGRVESFEQLDDWLFRHPWPVEGNMFPPMHPELVLIDTGGTRLEGDVESRTMQVYRWCIGRRARVKPIRGAARSRSGGFIWTGRGLVSRPQRHKGKPVIQVEIPIWFLDVHHFGDELSDLVLRGIDGTQPEVWELNRRNDPEYNQHLSNAVKVPVRKQTTVEEEWLPISQGARMDLWDAEVYQVAAAYMAGIDTLPSDAQLLAMRQAAVNAAKPKPADEREGPRGLGDAWHVSRFRV